MTEQNQRRKRGRAAIRDERRLKAIGAVIKRLRKERKLSQKEMAAELDCSFETISRIERGCQVLDFPTFLEIARVLKQPAFVLLLDIQLSDERLYPEQVEMLGILREALMRFDQTRS